jgi:hypothetical protein
MRLHWLAGLTLAAVAAVAVPAAGQSDPNPPCSSAVQRPSISLVEPGSSNLYATHTLRIEVSPQGDTTPSVKSASGPGAHFDDNGGDGPFTLVTDNAGPFPVTAVLTAFENGSPCDMTVSTTAQLASPAKSKTSKLRRPHYVVPRRRLYKPHPKFSFTVTPDKGAADRSPFTIRARVSRRFKLPGKGGKLRKQVYPQRLFERVERDGTFCQLALVCAPRSKRGFMKGVDVDVRTLGNLSGLATKGLKIVVTSPSGYPADRALKFFQTPWGLDLQVLQSGRQLARLKVVARCSGGGQSSRCRFKKVGFAR